MKTKKIENSSQISSIGYDEEKKVFQVEYKSGKTYNYFDVAPEFWEQVQTAESVGKFINSFIKPHKYQLVDNG